MNKKIYLSVVVSAFNEEEKIGECLESVKWANEIIFVDNGSIDKTVDIAKKYTNKIFRQKNDSQKIDIQKNFGIDKATGEWILVLDADEVISKDLSLEIKSVTQSSLDVEGFLIPRKNIIFGKWIEHTGWYPDYQLRLFRKGKARYEKKHVHQGLSLIGKKEKLNENIIHYNYESVAQFLRKNLLTYASNEADEKIRSGYKFSIVDIVRFPVQEFLRRYFSWEGYKDGLHGLLLSVLMAIYHFVIFVYIWEKNKFPDYPVDDFATDMKKEIKLIKKETKFWFAKKTIDEEKNKIKKAFLKVKRKINL